MTEDEMVGWHHQLNGHEFEQAQGIGDGQGSLGCCSPWVCKESHTTEQLFTNLLRINCTLTIKLYLSKCLCRVGMNVSPELIKLRESAISKQHEITGIWWLHLKPKKLIRSTVTVRSIQYIRKMLHNAIVFNCNP